MRFIPSIVFLFFSAILPYTAAAQDYGLDVGKHAPQFELKDLSGRTVQPFARGQKFFLLNFWSTLCLPCTTEMPSLNRLYGSLKEDGFEIFAVAIDSSDKPVREFALQNKLAFTILLDMEKEVFFDLYAGPSLPMSYLIDRNGIIIQKISGPREWDSTEITDRIRKLMTKR